jgi:DNA modification methylase
MKITYDNYGDIYNGDCLDVMKEIEDKSVDLVLTDPPYWHKKSPGKPYSERKQYKTNSKFATSDLYNFEGDMMNKLSDFTDKEVNLLLDVIKNKMKRMNAYIFCNDTLLPFYGMWAHNNNYHFSVLVWEKPLSIINRNRFSQHIEYIVRIYDYGTTLNKIENNSQYYSKVKRYNQVRNGKVHPTQKPLELIKELIYVSSKENDLVLDLYGGSMTTAIGCIETNRKFLCVELDKDFFKSGKNRIEEKINNSKRGLF